MFQEPKGYFKLERTCKVTAVRVDTSKKKTLYVFRIVWPMGAEEGEEAGSDGRGKHRPRSGDDRAGSSGAASSSKMAVTVGGAMVR